MRSPHEPHGGRGRTHAALPKAGQPVGVCGGDLQSPLHTCGHPCCTALWRLPAEHIMRRRRRTWTIRSICCVVAGLILQPVSPRAATVPSGFTEALIASGLASPTAMQFAPDGRLFVAEQGGRLRVIKNGSLLPTPFVTLSVDSIGERGLLGVAFDPNFAANQFVYVYYTTSTTPRHNRVSRFTANGDVAVPGSETLILRLNDLSGATNHNGGALHFGLDGKLYVAVGENAAPSNAQTLANLLGKMLRINP